MSICFQKCVRNISDSCDLSEIVEKNVTVNASTEPLYDFTGNKCYFQSKIVYYILYPNMSRMFYLRLHFNLHLYEVRISLTSCLIFHHYIYIVMEC